MMEKQKIRNNNRGTESSREAMIVRTSIIGIIANVFLAAFKAVIGVLTHSIAIVLDAVNNISDAGSSLITIVGTRLAGREPDKKHPFGYGRIEYLSAMIISVVIIKSGIGMLQETISRILGERNDAELAKAIRHTVVSFPEVQGAYDLVLNNYGPDTWNGSIHIEVPDTCSANELDLLLRNIQVAVNKEHHVILSAIGVYSVNTKDPEVIETRQRVQKIVFSHPHVIQMHAFYLVKEPKAIRFDVVISFDAEDRSAVYKEIVADVQKEFPDYQLQVALDADFEEE